MLILLQEGDFEAGFEPNQEWADQMFIAWEMLGYASEAIDRAEDLA